MSEEDTTAPEVPELSDNIKRDTTPNEVTAPLIEDPEERAAKVAEANKFIETSVQEIQELEERVKRARKFVALNTVGQTNVSLAAAVRGFQKGVRDTADAASGKKNPSKKKAVKPAA